MIVQRWLSKIHFVGKSSLMLAIPWQIRDKWNVKKGDQICLYEMEDVLVWFPLQNMPVRELDRLLEYLRKYPRQTVH